MDTRDDGRLEMSDEYDSAISQSNAPKESMAWLDVTHLTVHDQARQHMALAANGLRGHSAAQSRSLPMLRTEQRLLLLSAL